jgi:DNA-binding response OmpR family regulator
VKFFAYRVGVSLVPLSMAHRILIIEDDRDLAGLARMHLEDHGYEVVVRHDGSEGLAAALAGGFDLLLVDLMLPGTEGLEICRRVRNDERYTPLMILTARGAEVDRVLGLETGADDYLTKPISFRELVARVKALLRRVDALQTPSAAREDDEVLTHGPLRLDLASRSVTLDGASVELTAKEFDLLLHFVRNPGRVYTRTQLVDNVWGPGYDGFEHTVNSHINRLRGKISPGSGRERFVETVWGVGYRFRAEEPN